MREGYLLDTNHLGQAVTAGSVVRQKILELRTSGTKIGTCVPVLCEIEAGIQQVAQPEIYRRNLEAVLRQVRVWPIDRTTAALYGEIHHELKRRGRVVFQVDMMIAALVRQLNATLVTTDRDFEALPDIARENWLADSGTAT